MKKKLIFAFLVVFISMISLQSYAQCNSKVSAKTTVISENRGEVEVEITTSERFICKLNTVSGRGIDAVETKNGNGSSTIRFSNIDVSKMYQVEVEFTSEENQLCKRLQKNNLTFEPK